MPIRILTWNVALLPKRINPFHNPKEASPYICDLIGRINPDIIGLQEAFSFDSRRIIEGWLKRKKYEVLLPNEDNNAYMSRNGLILATKLGIKGAREMDFANNISYGFSIKNGIMSFKTAKNLWIHNTHIQSDALFGRATEYNENTRTTRQLQYHEAKNYLTEEFSFHTENHIFLGDFNEDYYDCHLNGLTKVLGLHHNNRKVITSPYDNTQKDYIFLNNRLKWDACNCDFTPITSSISDHYPLILDIYPKLNVQL